MSAASVSSSGASHNTRDRSLRKKHSVRSHRGRLEGLRVRQSEAESAADHEDWSGPSVISSDILAESTPEKSAVTEMCVASG